jgi:hypothetical protein
MQSVSSHILTERLIRNGVADELQLSGLDWPLRDAVNLVCL